MAYSNSRPFIITQHRPLGPNQQYRQFSSKENLTHPSNMRFPNNPKPFRMNRSHSFVDDNQSRSSYQRFPKNNPQDRSFQPRPAYHPPVKCPSVQAGYDCSELLEALKAIKDVAQCFSCHKPLTSARTCLKGHGICSNCRTRCNKNCPVCQSVILDLKPVLLNDIIKLLPSHCKYSSKGCECMIFTKDSDHENFCRFRTTDCRFSSCDWEGIAKDLYLHLENFHGREIIRVATQNIILMKFNATEDREGLAVIVAFNNIFWRHVRVKQNQLIQFYQYIPMEKPKKEYTVTIEYFTPEAHYSSVIPVHTDVFDREQLYNDQESFRLPKKIAKSFNRFHSGVNFTFKISQLD